MVLSIMLFTSPSVSVSATGFTRSDFAGKSHKYWLWEMQRCAHFGQCRVRSFRGCHSSTRLGSCSQPSSRGLGAFGQWPREALPRLALPLWMASWAPQTYSICRLTWSNAFVTSFIDLVLQWCSEHRAVKSNVLQRSPVPLPSSIDEVSNLVRDRKWVSLQDWFAVKPCWQSLIIFLCPNPLSIDSHLSISVTPLGSNVRLISL